MPKMKVMCSLCGMWGGRQPLRRIGLKRSGIYAHLSCILAGEKRLMAGVYLKRLDNWLESRERADS